MTDAPSGPPAPGSIRVIVSDSDAGVREALGDLVASDERFELVGTGGTVAVAVEQCLEARPHVAVVDVGGSGEEAARAIERIRRASVTTKVLVLGRLDDGQSVMQALSAGATGYLLKGARGDRVLDAIASCGRGELHFHVATGAAAMGRLGSRLRSDDG